MAGPVGTAAGAVCAEVSYPAGAAVVKADGP